MVRPRRLRPAGQLLRRLPGRLFGFHARSPRLRGRKSPRQDRVPRPFQAVPPAQLRGLLIASHNSQRDWFVRSHTRGITSWPTGGLLLTPAAAGALDIDPKLPPLPSTQSSSDIRPYESRFTSYGKQQCRPGKNTRVYFVSTRIIPRQELEKTDSAGITYAFAAI